MVHACAGRHRGKTMKDAEIFRAVHFDRHFETNSWEEANRAFFNNLAPKYDRLNEIISWGQQGGYRRAAVDSLGLKPGMRVLDVCTGSGDMAIEMARRCQGLSIDAVDMAEAMLAIAQDKANQQKCAGIRFRTGNALDLPFAQNTFDAVMISFGLRNLGDIAKGFREMHRVLKPGGVGPGQAKPLAG